MKFAVSTHSFLLAVEVDASWRVTDASVLNTGPHYGLALDPQNSRFLAKESMHGGREMTWYGLSNPHEEIARDPYPDMVRTHQMAIANGGLYVANTGFNSVVWTSYDTGVRHEYHVNGAREDVNHLNSVFVSGNQIFALLHNLHGLKLSQVVVLEHDPESGFSYVGESDLWHSGCHNVFVDEHRLYYNSSQDGKFVAVDLDGERVDDMVDFVGHTKGLAVTADHFFIGVSQHAEREERGRTQANIKVVDRASLREVGDIDLSLDVLPHPAGNVNELRILDLADHGHVRTERLERDWSSVSLSRTQPLEYIGARAKIAAMGVQRFPKRMKRRINGTLAADF